MRLTQRDEALALLQDHLEEQARALARDAGVEEIRITVAQDVREVQVENQSMFIEAEIRVTAQGRPRIAVG